MSDIQIFSASIPAPVNFRLASTIKLPIPENGLVSSEHDGTQSHEDSLQLLPEGVFSRKVIDTIRESMGESERKVSEFDDAAAPSVSAMGRKLRQSSVQVSTILSQSKKQELYNSFTHQAEEKRKIQQLLQGMSNRIVAASDADRFLRQEAAIRLLSTQSRQMEAARAFSASALSAAARGTAGKEEYLEQAREATEVLLEAGLKKGGVIAAITGGLPRRPRVGVTTTMTATSIEASEQGSPADHTMEMKKNATKQTELRDGHGLSFADPVPRKTIDVVMDGAEMFALGNVSGRLDMFASTRDMSVLAQASVHDAAVAALNTLVGGTGNTLGGSRGGFKEGISQETKARKLQELERRREQIICSRRPRGLEAVGSLSKAQVKRILSQPGTRRTTTRRSLSERTLAQRTDTSTASEHEQRSGLLDDLIRQDALASHQLQSVSKQRKGARLHTIQSGLRPSAVDPFTDTHFAFPVEPIVTPTVAAVRELESGRMVSLHPHTASTLMRSSTANKSETNQAETQTQGDEGEQERVNGIVDVKGLLFSPRNDRFTITETPAGMKNVTATATSTSTAVPNKALPSVEDTDDDFSVSHDLVSDHQSGPPPLLKPGESEVVKYAVKRLQINDKDLVGILRLGQAQPSQGRLAPAGGGNGGKQSHAAAEMSRTSVEAKGEVNEALEGAIRAHNEELAGTRSVQKEGDGTMAGGEESDPWTSLDAYNPQILKEGIDALRRRRELARLRDYALHNMTVPRVLGPLVEDAALDRTTHALAQLPATQTRQLLRSLAVSLNGGSGNTAGQGGNEAEKPLGSLSANISGKEVVGSGYNAEVEEPVDEVVVRIELKSRARVSRRMAAVFLEGHPAVSQVAKADHVERTNELFVEMVWLPTRAEPTLTPAESLQDYINLNTSEISSPFYSLTDALAQLNGFQSTSIPPGSSTATGNTTLLHSYSTPISSTLPGTSIVDPIRHPSGLVTASTSTSTTKAVPTRPLEGGAGAWQSSIVLSGSPRSRARQAVAMRRERELDYVRAIKHAFKGAKCYTCSRPQRRILLAREHAIVEGRGVGPMPTPAPFSREPVRTPRGEMHSRGSPVVVVLPDLATHAKVKSGIEEIETAVKREALAALHEDKEMTNRALRGRGNNQAGQYGKSAKGSKIRSSAVFGDGSSKQTSYEGGNHDYAKPEALHASIEVIAGGPTRYFSGHAVPSWMLGSGATSQHGHENTQSRYYHPTNTTNSPSNNAVTSHLTWNITKAMFQ